MIKSQDIKKIKLPDSPGIYFFKQNKTILYIGKATSLRDRVRSYFSSDLIQTRGPFLVDLIYKADKIDFIRTASVLEAIILEANLIKKHQPKYNTKEKDNKSFNYVLITKEYFPRILIMRGREIEKELPYLISNKFGPFTNSNQLKQALKVIRKIFPYRDRCLPMSGKPCFNRQLGLCPGVCDGSISQKEYQKIINKIIMFLSGKITRLKNNLEREMNILSKKQEFEKAGEIKRQIFALNHIQDVSLIKEEYKPPPSPSLSGGENGTKSPLTRGLGVYRIEAYDIAHLSGTNNVGVMVVIENGELKKSDYRKFIIKNSKNNDIGALKEILERRLGHPEWPLPNLIVVDGGLAQMNAVKNILGQELILIQILAVTKDKKHKAKAIIGDKNLITKYKKEILLINNEAHRFAIGYHRQKRGVIL